MSKKKVLLADDEPGFLEIMRERIKSWGYEVILASNGGETLEAIRNSNPDIIILDYLMPEMDGVVTLKRIREKDNRIPVIMLTAYSNTVIEGTEGLEVTAFVPKLGTESDTQIELKKALAMAEKKLSKR